MEKEIFIGLDVGTDSVGYAVTDADYNLIKHNGEPMWGATVFEAANTKADRRSFRTARRRLDRRRQRVTLTQEIFAHEIAKVDDKFYIRIKESGLYREDTSVDGSYFLFEGNAFNDIDYHGKYPTIHHLICELMKDDSPKDVRLVYLAVAWLMAHRGHFLNEVDKRNIQNLLSFDDIYEQFNLFFDTPLWTVDKDEFKKVMLKKLSVTKKENEFFGILNDGKKFKDLENDTVSKAGIIKLLSGGKIKPASLFLNAEYNQIESVSLNMPEENFTTIVLELGDDGELLIKLRALYDWMLLSDILGKEKTISAAKVNTYEQHKKDLNFLKAFVKKYIPGEKNDKNK